MANEIRYFVSYAHRNKVLVTDFIERLRDVLAPSKAYIYTLWIDHNLIVGEDWEEQISMAIDDCDFGLLLISPAFLASDYISKKELPAFVTGSKPSVPVMLQLVDFNRHDLKGLEKKQIFQFDHEGFKEPRAFGECSAEQRDAFVMALFGKIEAKLDGRSTASKESAKEAVTEPTFDLRLFELAAKAYRKRGTPKFFLDSQTLITEQKADIYDRVVLAERGRPSKNNPYRASQHAPQRSSQSLKRARYSFRRSRGLTGFFSTNRASTDSLNALQMWIRAARRSYRVCEDEDDHLVANLQFDESDSVAGPDLDSACEKYGVERTFVSAP